MKTSLLSRRVRSNSTVLGVLFTAGLTLCPVRAAQELPSDDAAMTHVLNRLAFGPRPGDVEAVRRIGVSAWIELQLQPEKLDNSAVRSKLATLQTLHLATPQLMIAYEGERALGKERKAMMPKNKDEALSPREKTLADIARKNGFSYGVGAQAVGEMQTAKLVRAVESPRQLQEVLVDFWTNHFNLDVNKAAVRTLRVADERDAIRPHIFGKFRDLLGASAHSPAMLWYLDNFRSTREFETPQFRRRMKNAPAAAQDAIPEAAMLAAPMPRKRGGLNENYARELMELHSLGVDGGYTQKDVTEVARCFTGWSVDQQDGRFIFRALAHDNGEKIVLGQRIAAGGGIKDGEQVLDLLANHPSTAKFISRKLAVRFVSDDPPQPVIDRAAQTFTATQGNLRDVVRTIITSPEFFAAKRQKIKSPFEYAVSSVRALDGVVIVPNAAREPDRLRLVRDGGSSLGRGGNGGGRNQGNKTLAREIATMGQPLFAFSAPTGYAENSTSWVSAGGLVARLNFALDIASDGVSNVQLDRTKLWERVDLNDASAIIDRLNTQILSGGMTPATRATLQKQTADGAAPDPNKLLALTLGSPEFQRR
ncbi:MAG TPA: DUF1800 domain-containing protein [Abditibacteriaceae bacterium]|jgi:uncharacterized protein (DUF1800 family)